MIDEEIESYLEEVEIPIRLAIKTKEKSPIVMSLWYKFMDGKFHCATHKNAKVVKYLKDNPDCGFEVACDLPPYRGIRGYGKAKIVKEKGEEILKTLLTRYMKDLESDFAKMLLKRSKNEVAIEITPQKIVTWDFSERMEDALKLGRPHPCNYP